MSILCIANQKGGVGKTTTAVNLAAGLARRGHRVLLVDLDIQGSATATLAGPADPLTESTAPSVADCLLGEKPISSVARETDTPGLFLAPAGEALATVDLHLASAMAREFVLRRCLAGAVADYDHVIIDTAPYLGLLTVNALAAATHVLVPVSCEYLPVLGLKLFGQTLAKIRASLNVPCEIIGYLLTMYDRRERITVEVEQILRRQFGAAVLARPIRIDTRHKAAPSHRQTIFDFESASGRGHSDYAWLAAEIDQRLSPGHVAKKPSKAASPSAAHLGEAVTAPKAARAPKAAKAPKAPKAAKAQKGEGPARKDKRDTPSEQLDLT